MKIVITFLLVASAFAVIPTKVENCGTAKFITWTSATFSVQPTKGVDETFSLYGTANDHVELSNVNLKAKWNGVDVFAQDYPNNEVYDKGDPVTFVLTQNFPTFTPSVSSHVNVRAKSPFSSGSRIWKERRCLALRSASLFES